MKTQKFNREALVAALDFLAQIDAQADDESTFVALCGQHAEAIGNARATLRAAGESCSDIEHMRHRRAALVAWGLEHRNRIWASLAGSELDRAWAGIHGWEN